MKTSSAERQVEIALSARGADVSLAAELVRKADQIRNDYAAGRGLRLVGGAMIHEHQDILKHGRLYLRRYFLARMGKASALLHWIVQSDTEHDPHDHPWDYSSAILEGGYIDTQPTHMGIKVAAGDVVHRIAEHQHRLRLLEPSWTLMVIGPRRRQWGFQTPRGWMPFDRYLGTGGTPA